MTNFIYCKSCSEGFPKDENIKALVYHQIQYHKEVALFNIVMTLLGIVDEKQLKLFLSGLYTME